MRYNRTTFFHREDLLAKDKNQLLNHEEIGLDATAFARLDVNHDGQLDPDELNRIDRIPVSAKITFAIVTTRPEANAPRLVLSSSIVDPRLKSIHSLQDVNSVIMLDDAELYFHAISGPRAIDFQQGRQFLMERFTAGDKDKNGYLDYSEAMARENPYFAASFHLIDRDGDGKMTLAELQRFLDLQQRAADSSVVLAIASRGRGLFEILDANRDGQLGKRELRSGWARLSAWDRDGDGLIALSELPRQFQLTLSRGLPPARGFAPGTDAAGDQTSAHGPLWFHKMDRNGDGDVSPREFLGSREDFRRIDLDGDGLIDVNEAKKADEWMRRNTRQK